MHLHLSGRLARKWANQSEETKKALDSKRRQPMTMEHQREGTYISNKVRIHACHPTLNHYTYFWFVTGKILNEVQQDCEQIKNHWVDDNKEITVSTLEREEDQMNPTVRQISKKREDQSCHQQESSGQPCNQETPSFPSLPYHPFRTSPAKSFCQVSHILSFG